MRFPVPHLQRIRVLSVHDGDTLWVYADSARDRYERLDVRLAGVWAPELAELGGNECRTYAEGWVSGHADGSDWPLMLETLRTPRSDRDTMTMSRYVGIVRCAEGHVLNDDVMAFVAAGGWGGGIGS